MRVNYCGSVKLIVCKVGGEVDRPQSLFDSYLKNFTAKLDWLVHSGEKPFV